MDTSKKYVEMCKGAEEIQEDHTTVEFDIYYVDFSKSGWKNDNEICSAEHNYDEKGNEIWEVPYVHENREYDERDCGMKYIWLPRQDQLQTILYKDDVMADGRYIVSEISAWCDNVGFYTSNISLEQLWLAFVMSEKFKKVWHDKKKEWNGLKCPECRGKGWLEGYHAGNCPKCNGTGKV